ncbi:protein phosphatase 2C domain-containing protein (plasmid) [Deinococcus psychrotolerans]|uniref:Protein phosphatase 2C domain-containing protein n=1 Tax=Deinococcus psychrotolerans TaxID=2489213 RepID=A0A3G8YJZ0_9DEIO|nr:PP2C family serine/threonine-protein phosphatase [Deinococcus psychrotolerans]AZI45263.1 protein phosphatase 2C domain-containing protein [Deinococcus psychrotolerans]
MSCWRHIHASVIGTSHTSTGQPCQDSHAVKVVTTGRDESLLLVVTSDGAGTGMHSDEGSVQVCEEVLRWLEVRLIDGNEFLTSEDGLVLIHNLKTLLQNYAEAEERNYMLRDLACTLNVAAVLPDRAWFLQVGDGAAVVQSRDTALELIFWPDNGEYANQTYFVTDVPDDHIHVRVVETQLERVALMTDGLQTLALALQQRSAHAPFFEPMFQALDVLEGMETDAHLALQTGLIRFLNSPNVNARTNDDKTLVLCSRRTLPNRKTETPVA